MNFKITPASIVCLIFLLLNSTIYAEDYTEVEKRNLAEANRHIYEGQYSLAARYLETILETQTDNSEIQFLYAKCLVENNELTEKTLFILKRLAVELNNDANLELYKFYYKQYKLEEAQKYLEIYCTNSRFYEKLLNKTNAEFRRIRIAKDFYNYAYELDVSAKIQVNQAKLLEKYIYIKGVDVEQMSTNDKKNLILKSTLEPNNLIFVVKTSKFPPYDKDILYYIRENSNIKGPFVFKTQNPRANETCPFFDPKEKKLYFSSDGLNSIGGFDIFYSNWNEESKSFSKPINMGFPINTPFDELYFVKGNDQFGFVSNRNLKKNEFELILLKKINDPKQKEHDPLTIAKKAKLSISASTIDFLKIVKNSSDSIKQPLPFKHRNKFDEFIYKSEANKVHVIISTYFLSDSIENKIFKLKKELQIEQNQEKRRILFSRLKKEEKALLFLNKSIDSCYRIFATKQLNNKFQVKVNEKYADFSISINSQYNENNPIPNNVAIPYGLVYRIQVGAFSKTKELNYFKGIAPLSLEESVDFKLVKYYAGFFYRIEEAQKALTNIKDLGIPTAYIVAFYDGKKLSIEKAIDLEEQK